MKEQWVVTVRTSLPNVCRSEEDIKIKIYEYDSFKMAIASVRDILRNYSFVQKNEMFDGNGNLINMKNTFPKQV